MTIAHVTSGGDEELAGSFTSTNSVNCGTAANKILVVTVTTTHVAALTVPASCTYAGVTLTPFTAGALDAYGVTWKFQGYYLVNPANGANNLVITCDWDGMNIEVVWGVWSSDTGTITVANQACALIAGAATQVSSVASAVGQTIVGIHTQASNTGTYAPDSPTVEHFEGFLGTSVSAQVGMRPGATPTSGLSWTGTNQPAAYAVLSLSEPAPGLTKKWAIPTNVADGTQRRLYIYNPTTFATVIDNQLVTASGGFFKYTDATLTVGQVRPAALLGFGADQTVDARGGAAWATGIEE